MQASNGERSTEEAATEIRTSEKVAEISMQVVGYNSSDFFQERKINEAEFPQVHLWYIPIPVKGDEHSVTWIHVNGIHKADYIRQLGQLFGIHSLLIEDLITPDQRPKAEDFGTSIFIVLKEIQYDEENDDIFTRQISFVIGADFLLSFQEQEDTVFKSIRARIPQENSRYRKSGPDYLLYTLLDTLIDNYFLVLEKIHHKIHDIEGTLLSNPTRETLEEIHILKREIISLRSIMLPSKEVLRTLQKGNTYLIEEATLIYLRDAYEHVSQAMDMFATFREMLSDMVDTYISSTDHQMNQVMKILTVMSTIFIPLTFISSMYGMNFTYMPELQWKWGYAFVIGVMLSITLGMILIFKKKKWF
ncbi:magnesium/cobalt transporter CorA [Deltaproteobacteria bacterium TL4]